MEHAQWPAYQNREVQRERKFEQELVQILLQSTMAKSAVETQNKTDHVMLPNSVQVSFKLAC